MDRWDQYFFDLCQRNAAMSKDPSTQVGAVIVRPDRTIASMGWNGFPRGVRDYDERYEDRSVKYKIIVHAECNAILSAREPLHGCTLYVSPMHPCANCAGMIVQAGIAEVVTLAADRPDWNEHFILAGDMFHEAGVKVRIV